MQDPGTFSNLDITPPPSRETLTSLYDFTADGLDGTIAAGVAGANVEDSMMIRGVHGIVAYDVYVGRANPTSQGGTC